MNCLSYGSYAKKDIVKSNGQQEKGKQPLGSTCRSYDSFFMVDSTRPEQYCCWAGRDESTAAAASSNMDEIRKMLIMWWLT